MVHYRVGNSIARTGGKTLTGPVKLRVQFVGWVCHIPKQRNNGEERGDFLANSRNFLLFFAQNEIWVFHGVLRHRSIPQELLGSNPVESEEI